MRRWWVWPSLDTMRSRARTRAAFLLSIGFLLTPQIVVARTFEVPLRPDVASVARFAAPLAATRGATDDRVVLPILLEPGEEIASVQAPFPVTDLGTAAFHGRSIAHLAVQRRDLEGESVLVVSTRPSSAVVASPLRADPDLQLAVQRLVQQLVVNPEAIAHDVGVGRAAESAVAPGRPFEPSVVPSLDGSPVRLLILTRESLAPAFEAYAEYWTQLGVPAVVRTVEWVTANYPTGADLAETLRGFVREAYALWGIRSLLLGGDTDLIPTRYVTSIYSLEGETLPTDLYFACLDGDWNADRDSRWGEGYTLGQGSDMADLYPELRIGRLPVTIPEEVAALLVKLQRYAEPSVVDYQDKILFLAEVIWPSNYKPGDPIQKNGADNAERIRQQNGLTSPAHRLTRLYETPVPYPGSEPLTQAAALAAMGAGYGIVTDIGHGFRYTMSLGDLSMTNANAVKLANASRPFFLNMLNCSAAAFDFPCLAEKFLLNPNGGAIGVIGASREAYPDNIQLFQEAWFNKLFLEGYTGAAAALNDARLRYVSQTFEDGAYRWSNLITTYLGDPEVEVWLAAPRPATVVAPAAVALGTGEWTVSVTAGGSPVPGASVCAWKPGDAYAVTRTNLAGVATLRLAAGSPGTIQLAVSGAGLQVHRGTVTVSGTPGPALHVVGTPVIVDTGSGAVGNGNGKLEAGETALLQLRIENTGNSVANTATVQVSCSEPALQVPSTPYTIGTLLPGASVLSPSIPVHVAQDVLDQQKVRVDVSMRTFEGWSWTDRADLDLLQCAPRVLRTWVDDKLVGNGSGVPDANETYDLRIDVRNYGFGSFAAGSATLLTSDPDVVLVTATSPLPTLAHLGTNSISFRLRETNVQQSNRMTLLLQDGLGRGWTFPMDTRRPTAPTNLETDSSYGPGSVRLAWTASTTADLAGHVVYRSKSRIGPWDRASRDLIRSAAAFLDQGLESDTDYYYAVSAVDSCGNESVRTATLEVHTNPALLDGWPRPLGIWSNSSPVVADLDGDSQVEVVVGAADQVYAWHPDGSEVRDGDSNPATSGVFASIVGNFMPGLAAADLDQDGRDEIVGCTFDTRKVYVFQGDGSVRAGWPRPIVSTTHSIWATPALGDLDLDGELEIVILGLDGRLYAWHADGSEVRDGDANPATQGVFFVIPGSANWSRGAPAIANVLPSDGTPEIVFGTENALVYVLRANGSVGPGWPRAVGDRVNAAPSVGDLDGDGALEIAVPVRNGFLYVLRSNGTDMPGWPRPLPNLWNALTPSVALADFDADGRPELVAASTGGGLEDGSLYVFDAQGNVRPGWPVDVHTASESSPIVGDLDGDGALEIVYGGETGILHGLRADGTVQPGFPIRSGAEIRSTPLLVDVDGEGHVDLVFPGWDQQVYIWKFQGLYQSQRMPWPAFKGNLLRNGLAGFREPTSVQELPGPPRRTALYPNLPNPFNPSTLLRYDIAGESPQRVRLAIYDARGRRVRVLVDAVRAPGRFSEPWDGRDDRGVAQPSGVYFSRLVAGDARATRKLVLLR